MARLNLTDEQARMWAALAGESEPTLAPVYEPRSHPMVAEGRARPELPEQAPAGVTLPGYWAALAGEQLPGETLPEPSEGEPGAMEMVDQLLAGQGDTGRPAARPMPEGGFDVPANLGTTQGPVPKVPRRPMPAPLPAAQPQPAQQPRPQPAAQGPAAAPQQAPQPAERPQRAGPSPMLQGRTSAPMRPEVSSAPRPMPDIASPGVDTGAVALAMLGDMLLNKGRGAGRILQMYGLDRSPLDREMQRAQIEATRSRGARQMDPLERELKQAQIADVRHRTAMRGQPNPYEARLQSALELRQAEFAQKYDPNHPQARALQVAQEEYLTTGTVSPQNLAPLNMDARKVLASAMNASADIARTPLEARSQAQIAGARTAATERAGFGYDVKRAELGEDFAERREERATGRGLRGKARDMQLQFVESDTKLEQLEGKLDELIAQKGADYKVPSQGNIAQRFYTSANKSLFGGTGMDQEDSELFVIARNAGLGTYIQDAGNAPNTLPEQAAAFDNFFQTGSLGAMKRRLQTIRQQGRTTLERKLDVLQPPSATIGAGDEGDGNTGGGWEDL